MITGARWRKSTRSGDATNCVEVAFIPQAIGVRDSKHPAGPILTFPAAPWTDFLRIREPSSASPRFPHTELPVPAP